MDGPILKRNPRSLSQTAPVRFFLEAVDVLEGATGTKGTKPAARPRPMNQVLCGQPRGPAVPRRTFIMMVFTAARLYTPLEEIDDPLLFVQDGTISKVSSRAQSETPQGASLLDFGDAILAPGFVDIHMHGGTGAD